MSNPTYNATPVPFDPPDAPAELYAGLSTGARQRLVKLHQSGGQTTASGDASLKSAGLLMTLGTKSYVSPAGCSLAVFAHYQGVTP